MSTQAPRDHSDMKRHEDTLMFSATDLGTFGGCRHATLLDREAAHGRIAMPHSNDPAALLLKERGREHEARYLASLEAPTGAAGKFGERVTRVFAGIPQTMAEWRAATERTVAAMRAGHRVIAQAPLASGRWSGIADFLVRVDASDDRRVVSTLGSHAYEVVEAKLAFEVRAQAVLQLCVYSSILETLQGCRPEHMTVVSPARGRDEPPVEHRFRTDDFGAYFEHLRGRMEAFVDVSEVAHTYPEPCDRCGSCRWSMRCDARRRNDDHLSLVAGASRLHRELLEEAGVTTLAALGQLTLPWQQRPRKLRLPILERLHHQARLQLEARTSTPRFELLPVEAGVGLCRLPTPSPGDVFLDFEADRFAEGGTFYDLFGWVEADERGELSYHALWSNDHAEERRHFEAFVDHVERRRAEHPDLHVYHFASFEKTALGEMSLRHLTREAEIDGWLREGVLVDLMPVVKQSLRAGVERYSLKELERFYGYVRRTDLREAGWALRNHALQRLTKHPSELVEERRTIQAYNREDCESTWHLRRFLERERQGLIDGGVDVPRPSVEGEKPAKKKQDEDDRTEELRARLLADVPEDPALQTPEQRARRLLADLLDWHRRESKPAWWEYFRQKELLPEERLDDRVAIGELGPEKDCGKVGGQNSRSNRYEYSHPPQEHGIRLKDVVECPVTGQRVGRVIEVDTARSVIAVQREARKGLSGSPVALIRRPDEPPTDAQRGALASIADDVLACREGAPPSSAAWALLTRAAPSLRDGAPLQLPGESPSAALQRVAPLLTRTVLPVQGPPGAGKTYSGSHMIVALIRAGKKVGITASSHQAIRLLLQGAHEAADAAGVTLRSVQRASDEGLLHHPRNASAKNNAAVAAGLRDHGVHVAAGTAWLWADEAMRNAVDVLVIDEAGQFSLANALSVSVAADSLVLLGDPQQLAAPSKAGHPEGAEASALEHLLDGEPTIAADKGLFLDETWRLPPAVAAFTSAFFYRGRLRHHPDGHVRRLESSTRWAGSGVRFEAVEHHGNVQDCPEEGERLVDIARELLGGTTHWVDLKNSRRPLRPADVLVVAPYNAQVVLLTTMLREADLAEVRVGTVDKFQGQEAPLVFYSMTTSDPEDAPRGLEFLYSPQRLNVATSRTQAVVVVLANPRLLEPDCKTPRQMRWVNGLCGARLHGATHRLG